MAATTTPRPRISPSPPPGARAYDAFVSYSHAADGRLAPALQAGLQSLAKPWYRRRALRVFRDKTSLSASPELWSAIEAALAQSRYFVLVASPEAAASHWVDQEVRWWRAHRSHDTVLIALTDGELGWDAASGDFDASAAIPPGLRGWFPREPLWVDLRWARDARDVSMRNPRFRESVGELAAPLHGVPKDELIGEDISQHRRTLRLARGAVTLLVILLALAVVGGIVALIQRNEAIEQKRLAQSEALAATAGQVLRSDPLLSARLAAEAVRVEETVDSASMLTRAVGGLEHELLLQGHETPIRTAAFSPDGDRVVTADTGGTVRIWDAASAAQLKSLRGHEDWISSAVFSPDGDRVVTASRDGTARIWDADRGTQLESLGGPARNWINEAAFSPDGERVVTAGSNGTARIWHADSGALLETIRVVAVGSSRDYSVYSAAFSPDGERLLTAGGDGAARIWDADSGAQVGALPAQGYAFSDAAFGPDGERVVTVGEGLTTPPPAVWDADSGAHLQSLRGHKGYVYSATFSPDGERVVTAGNDRTARIWDSDIGAQVDNLSGHGSIVFGAAFSLDGERVVTAGEDLTARIWDADSGARPTSLHSPAAYHSSKNPSGYFVDGAAFSPDGELVVTAGTDARVRIWDAETGAQLERFRVPGTSLSSATFSPDGERLATASGNHGLRIWDVDSGAQLERLRERRGFVYTVAFSPGSERVVTSGIGPVARIWDADSAARPKSLRGHVGGVNSATFSPDGERVVTAGYDGTARIWDAESGAELHSLSGHSADDPAQLKDVVYSAAFSPDGDRVVTASQDGTARIWDADSGAQLENLSQLGRRGDVNSAAFSPDGDRVVTASEDGTARIWDADSGALLDSLGRGGSGAIEIAAFSPDGGRVLTAGGGAAQIWECGDACESVPALLELASQRAGSLSTAERAQYLPE